ncbi:hypothetical protein SDC9_91929 [bioreactor metagenome]|uniref:Uncharacterized protein n=1 Tax=bioreactor metagenome TaxID=1076179 RepID=A0A645A309_9ZZZZ
MQHLFVFVEVFHKRNDTAFVAEALDMRGRIPFVCNGDADARVEKRHLAEAAAHGVEAEIHFVKHRMVG